MRQVLRVAAFFTFVSVAIVSSAHAQPPASWSQFNQKQRDALSKERQSHQTALRTEAASVASPFTLTSVHFVQEVDGTISVVGEIQNATALTLTFPNVTFNYFLGASFLGSVNTYAFASQNVRLSASGLYTSAMPPGAIAFFKAYSSISYSLVTTWTASSTAENFGFTPAVGQVSVTSVGVAPDGIGGTNVAGTVSNSASRALTFFTQVALAGYQGGTIADVTFTYVSGVSVPCDSVTSTSGVLPSGTAPFQDFFLHPVTAIGRAYVSWDEFAINLGGATGTAAGGTGSLQVSANCGWTASSDSSWIAIIAGASGAADGAVTYSVAPNSVSTPRTGHIFVKGIPFTITQSGATVPTDSAPPFGVFDTPANNIGGVTGSIAVTGWALDDAGVTAVRIMRDPVVGEAPGLKPIGTAAIVAGARPDVANLFPAYPNNNRAGWGYMMLTNFLPNGGTGTYVIHAIADDAAGHSTLLGSRTITCTNSTATLPFGAIDTPGQGETVSGVIPNFGWVLSPGFRRADPPGGGIVTVFVDGLPVGSPGGWAARPDLTALFPVSQYSGINTALAVFGLDTTALSNGAHTIAWGVQDSVGGGAGVGSRFFTVSNGSGLRANSRALVGNWEQLRIDRTPIRGRRGFDLVTPYRDYRADASGRVTVQSEEVDRIELLIGGTEGGIRVGARLDPLPIGSHLDPASGTFTWQPGVGFVGAYDFVFWNASSRREIRIVLNPQRSNRVGPQVVIDAPKQQQGMGRSFIIGGWAADLNASVGTGIETLHIWAYPADGSDPVFLGVASLGDRPDVAAIYGEQFLNSGYGLAVDNLSPGTYTLAVFAWSTAKAEFLPARTSTFTVR